MLAILTLGVACSSGVSDEEFATVRQELRAAKLQAESLQADLQRNVDEVATLGSDLQGNADEVASLMSQLDEAETMNAKLESNAMEAASVQSRLDQAQENLSDLGAELDAAQA